VERLIKLDVDADLTFGQLTLEKLPIQNAVLKASGQGGLLTLENLRGDLYKATSKPRARSTCANRHLC
jgi:AsmA protein